MVKVTLKKIHQGLKVIDGVAHVLKVPVGFQQGMSNMSINVFIFKLLSTIPEQMRVGKYSTY